jgi:hypothetical protein
MYKKGNKIGANENFTDYYRRYMDLNSIIMKLRNRNMSVVYSNRK